MSPPLRPRPPILGWFRSAPPPRRSRPTPPAAAAGPASRCWKTASALSTLTVTASGDDATQAGTLRYAVAHARSGDTILLTAAVKAPIVLSQGELVLSRDVTIESVPARTPTISGDGQSRIFEIAAGARVTLSDLNLSDGDGVANNPAGTSRDDGYGGAILNLGTLTVSGSSFTSNSARVDGGGLFNDGTLTVSGSSFTSNSADFGGGLFNGPFNLGVTATVSGCSFTSNSAGRRGGGMENSNATATVSNSTFTSNTAAAANLGDCIPGVANNGGLNNENEDVVTLLNDGGGNTFKNNSPPP